MARGNKSLRKLWKRRLTNWESSQQSGVAWCRANNIPYPTFSYWKKKLGSPRESVQSTSLDSFIEIEETKPDQAPGLEIDIQGAVIRVNKDFDAETLLRCCEVLRRNYAISIR